MHVANKPATTKGSDSAAWAVLLIIIVAVAALQVRRPLSVELIGLTTLALACLALAATGIFYASVRKQRNFSAMCFSLMQVLVFSCVASILSYLLAREGGPLWDATFSRWDKQLGFDWLAYVRWIDGHTYLAAILRFAYASLIPQMIAVVLALGFAGRLEDLRATMLAAMVSGTVTVLLSPLFPAVSNFVSLDLTAADFQNINPWAGYSHLSDFNALREGRMTLIRIPDMQGIVTFPSYHAALATVTCWGFWRSALAPVRLTGCSVALATIVATPVDGGHYLVDVLAGVAIAVASIMVSRRWIYWRVPRMQFTALPFHRLRAASVQ